MRIQYKGLIKDTLPSGNVRWRVRVEGERAKRIKIPHGPGHEDFLTYYKAARLGMKPGEVQKPATALKHSVKWLCDTYLAYLERRVAQGISSRHTLRNHRSLAKNLCAQKSEGDLSQGRLYRDLPMAIPSVELVKLRDRMMDKPSMAETMFKFLRALYKFANEREYCATNPAAGIKVETISKGGAVAWTVEDLKQYTDRHPIGSTAYLCMALFMFSGCRIGDGYRLGHKNESISNGRRWLSWQPEKKGSEFVEIEMHPMLTEAIDAMTVVGPTYLLKQSGQPFASENAMGNRIAKWCDQAGLKNRSSHGWRKALGHMLALKGASQYQIMSVHGHSNAETSEIYTKGVDRAALASSVSDKMKDIKW